MCVCRVLIKITYLTPKFTLANLYTDIVIFYVYTQSVALLTFRL